MEEGFTACFQAWIRLQESDLEEVVQTAASANASSEAELRELLQKNMRHYEEYYQQRRLMVRECAPSFVCPHWCNPFESSFLWMGGCRPPSSSASSTLTSSAAEAMVQELFTGGAAATADIDAAVIGLSAAQLRSVNELHMVTVREEDRLSSRMASLQESVADKPLLPFALVRERRRAAGANKGREVERVMVGYQEGLAELIEAADAQRIATARELLTQILTQILTPKQAVELLTAAKRLHLSLHEWVLSLNQGPLMCPIEIYSAISCVTSIYYSTMQMLARASTPIYVLCRR